MRPALLAMALAAACALPPQEARVRVIRASPEGDGVDPEALPAFEFSGAVDPEGLMDGRRVLLARAADLSDVLAALESESGAEAGAPRVPCQPSLEGEGTRLVLRPDAPLAAGASFALVLSSRARAADGRQVLDAEGRPRPTVVRFVTASLPPPTVLITEVLADAATPEAGGEYAEVLNVGPGPLDLTGWRLEKRSATGSWSGCTIGQGAGGPVAAGGLALVVGGGWDGRYPTAAAVARFPCGSTSLAGGIANDRPPVLRLLAPGGAEAAILDASALPLCGGALEIEAPLSVGDATCCACTDGSPGWLP